MNVGGFYIFPKHNRSKVPAATLTAGATFIHFCFQRPPLRLPVIAPAERHGGPAEGYIKRSLKAQPT